MATLATFKKQPADVQDYDISFVEWLAALNDTQSAVTPVTVTTDAGITQVTPAVAVGGVVKVWLSGGVDATSYKVTATLTTTGGRTKQAEITIKVKEV